MNSFRFTNRGLNQRGFPTRAERRLQPRRGRTIAAVRRPLALAAVCAVIFACAFVLGRGGGAAAPAREGVQWVVPAVAAGSAIPATLASAPPIEVQQPLPAPARSTGTGTHAAAGTGARPTLTEHLVTEAPTTPASAPAPAAPRTPPAATPPTSKSGPSSGGSGTIAHPGESFDTSG